jgi:chemotaxis protein histidine kinase CheA
MAKTVEVDLEVKSNLEPTIKNLRELKKQLRETAAGSKEFDKLSASIRDMEDSISDAKATNDDFLGQLENASGPLGTLGQGIRGAERTFSSFNGALKASIIGIIVAAVAGLAAAFNNNEKAQKKLQPIMQAFEKILGGVFAVVEPLFDTFIDLATKALPYVSDAFKVVYSSGAAVFQLLGKLGSAVKKLISGDFSGAWDDAKSSVTGFSKNFNDAKTRFEKGSNEMTKLEKENAAKRAEALEKENERKKAAAEKAAAEAEARRKAEREAEEKDYQERSQLARERGEKSREDLENAEKLARDIRQKNIDATKTENQLKVEAENAEFERQKALLVAANLSTEELDKLHKENLNKLELEYWAKQSEASATATAKEKELSEARRKITEEEYRAKIAQATEAANLLGALGELAGRQTIAGKALGIASATINTYVGVSEALKQKSTLPSPFDVVAKVVNVATVLATGFKAVKAISAVKVPGGGGGGGSPTPISVSGGAVASAPAAAPQFNVVGTSGQNQIAQSLGNQAPVKAFVVSNDVTTAQSLDRNIVKTATIG